MKLITVSLLCCAILVIKCDQYSYEPYDSKYDYDRGNYDIFDLNQNKISLNVENDAFEKNNIPELLNNVLTVCDQSFSKAERKINLVLNEIYVYEGKSNLIEDFISNYSSEESIYQTSFPWKFISPSKIPIGKEIHQKYVESLVDILVNVREACLTLPPSLPDENLLKTTKNQVIASFIHWSKIWFAVIEDKLKIFFEKCQPSNICSKLLAQVIDLSVSIEKDDTSDINEALEGILHILKNGSYLGKNLPDLFHLWYRLLKPEHNEYDPYWIAEGLHKEVKHGQTTKRKLKFNKGKFGKNKGDLEIDTDFLVHEVAKEFLSVAFGSKLIQENFRDLPEKRSRLLNLAFGLVPTYIRMGGSAANFLSYTSNGEGGYFSKIKGWSYDQRWKRDSLHPKLANFIDHQAELCEKQIATDFTNFTMTSYEWKFLVDFVKDLKTVLLFDLNQFMRNDNGFWDPTNARLLLKDSITKEIPIIWQLGNEPNSYKHAFGWSITPEEAAIDYKSLRNELETINPHEKHVIVGPDVTRPRKVDQTDLLEEDSMKFLSKFLRNANDAVDVVSWHQYYVNGRTATLSDFTSKKNMNLFVKQVKTVVQLRDKWAPKKPIWLTETANAYGGGSYQLSQTFAATFLWLDKLGSAALGGISMVYRQTLFGGCYGLLDRKLRPTPNYWVSVLHKQLVGQKVLLPRVRLAPKGLRIYAHCMNKGHQLYETGAVVVFGINVGNSVGSLHLSDHDQYNSTIYEFRLSAPFDKLRSEFTLLNGEILEVSKTGKVPILVGQQVPSGQLVLPPKSIMFYVLPQAHISFC